MKELAVAINNLIRAFKASDLRSVYPFDNLKIKGNEGINN